MTIGDQTGQDIDEAIEWAVLNLRNILELIDDTFDDGTFAEQDLIDHRHQTIFHVSFDLGD